jgi:1,4-alpha-glucan branching enzyme
MFGHAGKKLLFMGQDFAQKREWSEERELDWFLLAEKPHQGLHAYVKELLKLYRKHPCLYVEDRLWDGFEWMNADDADHSTFVFVRKDPVKQKGLLFIINFTPVTWKDYVVGVPLLKKYKLELNSDDLSFGGAGDVVPKSLQAVEKPYHYQKYSATLDLPGYGAMVYSY